MSKQANRSAADDAKAAQEARSARYHIGIKDGGNVTKPAEFADVPDSDYGDPVNYRYPMPDKAHADDAASRWGDAENRRDYDSAEQAIISKRIADRQASFGEGADEDERATPAHKLRQAARAAARLQRAIVRQASAARRGGKDRADQDAVSLAMQRLAAMPSVGDDGKDVPVPFRYEAAPPFKVRDVDMVGATHAKIPLRGVVALEPVVRRKQVEKDIKRAGAYNRIPWVVKHNGTHYVIDGTHRLTADALLGKDQARVNVVAIGRGE